MLFRQLFDRESCTYTYLLADTATGAAALIDPVLEHVDRDAELIAQLGLTLRLTLDTHVHADHVTGSGVLRDRLGSQAVLSRRGEAPCVDVQVDDGDVLELGVHRIEVRATPGHTSSCVSYYVPDLGAIFTGDTLLVRGCGRTDFQQGDARQLFASVHDRILSLPDDTVVWPAHDYLGCTCSTVGEERRFNPRLGGGRTVEQFVAIMAALDLAMPQKLHVAVPANQNCGVPRDRSPE